MYSPLHDQERNRLTLFSLRQTTSLESYTTEFSRVSFQVPELDDLSHGLLFARGLQSVVKRSVLSAHPTTLDQAIRSAQTCHQLISIAEDDQDDEKKVSAH